MNKNSDEYKQWTKAASFLKVQKIPHPNDENAFKVWCFDNHVIPVAEKGLRGWDTVLNQYVALAKYQVLFNYKRVGWLGYWTSEEIYNGEDDSDGNSGSVVGGVPDSQSFDVDHHQ